MFVRLLQYLPCAQKDKHLLFEDPKATTSDPDGSMYAAKEWLETIDKARKRSKMRSSHHSLTADQARELAISQSLTNSYSGDSTFNDLSSTVSSPASTLGGDGALEGVNIPAQRLRKDHEADNVSLKGRKRFSKRHSKNGLAAVF